MTSLARRSHGISLRCPGLAAALALVGCGAGGSPGLDAGLDDAGPDPVADLGPAPAGDAGPDAGPPAGDGFGPWPGLDPGGRARALGAEAFIVLPASLRADPDGGAWVLWHGYELGFEGRSPHLEHVDGEGRFVESSALADLDPAGFVVHADGGLTAWRNACDAEGAVCLRHVGPEAERAFDWAPDERAHTVYRLDEAGDVVGSRRAVHTSRVINGAAADGPGLYVLTFEGSIVLHRLGADLRSRWSLELLPALSVPLPPDAPIDEVLRAIAMTGQRVVGPVEVEGGVVLGATVPRGGLSALAASRGVVLPRPADPTCHEMMIIEVPEDGSGATYRVVPTEACELLPEVGVLGEHAFVAAVVDGPSTNDAAQSDISLAVVDRTTGDDARHRTFAFEEDDVVHGMAPCGERMCLVGLTGSRSVDTGSRVTYGRGFVLPLGVDGEAGPLWTVGSPRHAVTTHAAPGRDGRLLFVATVNGPITHTADHDPSLRFNEAIVGELTVPSSVR